MRPFRIDYLSSTPKLKRKRLRSLTPSEIGINGGSKEQDVFRSPLAKRKKLAAGRTGYSKLKETINADDLEEPALGKGGEGVSGGVASNPSADNTGMEGGEDDQDDEDDDDDDDEEEEEEEEEDDFLTRELEEEWG